MAGIGEYDFQSPGSTPPPSPPPEPAGGSNSRLILTGVLVVLVLAAAAYFLFTSRVTRPASSPQASTAPPPAPKAEPDDYEHINLPPLDDSDALVRQRVGVLSSNPLVTAWLGTKGIIRNFVVVVENISHGMNPSRHLRVLKPAGEFRVMMRGSQTVIDPRSYDRFSRIEEAAASIDARSAGRLYKSFKPLLQMAYDELGNQESIDRAVERTVNSLLQVPAIDGDVRVERTGEGIGYEYTDQRLDELNGAQKQLLRMGPKNIRSIQSQLRTFAATIGLQAN